MTVLRLSKKLQIFMSIYVGDWFGAQLYKKTVNIIFIAGMSVLIAGTGSFIALNFMQLAESTNAMVCMMAGCSGVACYCGITSNIESTRDLYILLENLATESVKKYPGFSVFYEAEERSHSLAKWFTMFMMLFFTFGTILLSLGMSLWNVYQQNYDTSTWFLPYNMMWPIDKSTLTGWYFELFMQGCSGYAFVLTICSTVTFFGGCSFYFEACYEQFKRMMKELRENSNDGESKETIEDSLFDIIIFHNKIFEMFDLVAEIYSVAIFFHLICNVLFFAAAIFQMELTFGSVGLSLFFNVLCVMEGLSYTFILCYYANLASSLMLELANVVYLSDWYYHSPRNQKLLVLIIARAQIPNVFMGLKVIYCSLEAFTRLNKTAATYYIMFRNIAMK